MTDFSQLSVEELEALRAQLTGEQPALPPSRAYVEPDPEDWKTPYPGPMARVGRGFFDIGQGAKELFLQATGDEGADQYSQDLKDEIALYEKGRGEDAGSFDWLRVGGQTAALLPFTEAAGLAAGASKLPSFLSLPARFMSTGGAQGAVAGLVAPTPENSPPENFAMDKAVQTGVGAAAGMVIPPIVRGIAKGLAPYTAVPLARLANTVWEHMKTGALVAADGELTTAGRQLVQKLGYDPDNVPDEVRQALGRDAASATSPEVEGLTPEQRVRRERFKRVTGDEPTRGQLTRRFEDQQEEQSLSKLNEIGGPLRTRFESQNAGLIKSGKDMVESAGGSANDLYDVGKLAGSVVKGADKAASDAVSELYGVARKRAEEMDLGMSPDKLLEKIHDIRYQYGADTVLPKVQMWLREQGLMDAEGNLVRTGPNSTRGIEVTKVEELRKMLSGMYGEGLEARNHNRVVRSLIRSLDNDVMDWAGEDVYKGARAAAKARFDDLEIPGVKELIDGDIAPEDFVDKFVRRGKIDDLQAFRTYLFKSKDPAAADLWNSIKAEALRQVFTNSVRRGSLDSLENPEFTSSAMESALDKWGRNGVGDRRWDILLTRREKALLNDILQTAKDRVPIRGTTNPSGTSADIWNTIDRMIASAPIPGVARMVFRGALRSTRSGVQTLEKEEAVKRATTLPGEVLNQRRKEAMSGFLGMPAPNFFGLAPAELRRARQEGEE